jgi:tetratricopeptide (TPR) repeat protein
VLGSLSFSIGATRAFAAPQTKANPAAPQTKANPAAKSAANSAEFKKLAARATEARDQNRLQEAAGLYEKALRLNPRWEEGWWYLGTVDYDADIYGDGVKAFRNLVELDPKYGPAWAFLGLCEFETHDYGNAFIHLEMAKSKGLGNNAELWNVVEYHLALLDILHSEFEASNKLLSDLVQHNVLSPDVEMAFGLTLLRVPLLPDQIDPEKHALISEAGKIGELVALKDFDEADKSFQQLVRDYPTTPFIHYAYGYMLANLAQYREAEREFQEEIKVNGESAMPYVQLAYVYIRGERFKEALPLARKAVQMTPHFFVAHYLLGRALFGLGQVYESITELSIAKRLEPFSPEVRYNLAQALARAKRPRDAAREQAEFQRLTTALRAKDLSGADSYRESNERGELEPHQVQAPEEPSRGAPPP